MKTILALAVICVVMVTVMSRPQKGKVVIMCCIMLYTVCQMRLKRIFPYNELSASLYNTIQYKTLSNVIKKLPIRMSILQTAKNKNFAHPCSLNGAYTVHWSDSTVSHL